MSDDIKEPTVAMRYALTRIKALEAQFAQAMELLEDVPGEVLLDRVNRIAEWHHSLGEAFYEMRDEKEALETELTAAREALENSQSLLAMINHLGSDRPTGIASLDWDNEGLSKLTAEQITDNRAAIASLPAPEEAAPPREGRHPVERLWRECGLPEYFLGNDGSNTKLYALYDAILALKSAPAK